MNDKAIATLRLDKRLAKRDDWIEPEDLQRELDSLPDVSQKATTLDDEKARAAAPAASGSPVPAAPAPAAPAPAAAPPAGSGTASEAPGGSEGFGGG